MKILNIIIVLFLCVTQKINESKMKQCQGSVSYITPYACQEMDSCKTWGTLNNGLLIRIKLNMAEIYFKKLYYWL